MKEMDEKELFEAGCFLPSWTEDVKEEETSPISQVYSVNNKDVKTLLAELAEIKNHIEDVRQREWDLANQIRFHENNFVKD